MVAGDRSFSVILQDILRNFQEMIRSEVKLAKIELRDEAAKAKRPVQLLGSGAVFALFAILFLLLSSMFALALVIPIWAAALAVGGILAIVGTALLSAGLRHFRKFKEDTESTWAKQ
jgi:uncharacterized membrane protein YqjE